MKILSKNFIKKFKGKIVNIHPSYLPKYKGLNTSIRALRNNEKFSGCTVHYVSANLDSGKIILQKKVKINRNETPKSLEKKIEDEKKGDEPQSSAQNKFSAAEVGWRMIIELTAGVFIGFGLGYGLDFLFGTKPVFILILTPVSYTHLTLPTNREV